MKNIYLIATSGEDAEGRFTDFVKEFGAFSSKQKAEEFLSKHKKTHPEDFNDYKYFVSPVRFNT